MHISLSFINNLYCILSDLTMYILLPLINIVSKFWSNFHLSNSDPYFAFFINACLETWQKSYHRWKDEYTLLLRRMLPYLTWPWYDVGWILKDHWINARAFIRGNTVYHSLSYKTMHILSYELCIVIFTSSIRMLNKKVVIWVIRTPKHLVILVPTTHRQKILLLLKFIDSIPKNFISKPTIECV